MSKTYPYAYIRKKICPISEAVIPINCKAVQYGQGCFAGIRGNWNPNHKQLYIFRLEDHYNRLKESAKILGMTFKYSLKQFSEIISELIRKNKIKENCYIRPTLYSASTKLTPRFDNPDDDLAIYMISLKDYFKTNDGLNTCISSWRRVDDDTISVKAKSTGAYAASALAKTDAINNGYDEPIYLNRQGMVSEASGANIFGIKDNIIYTPPLSTNILNGITRRSLIELAKSELKIEVREENFDRSPLFPFDELFFSGTAAKLAWIKQVDQRTIGNGKLGHNTKKLNELLEQVMINELPAYAHWNFKA